MEYEKVNDEDIDKPGVIWNGTEYARVKNTDWSKIDYINFTNRNSYYWKKNRCFY